MTITLNDVRLMEMDFITPDIVAKVLGCNPHYIRVAAANDPASLGFPLSRVGNRTKIPRLAFIHWMETGTDGIRERKERNGNEQ